MASRTELQQARARASEETNPRDIECNARRRLHENCQFRHYFREIEVNYEQGVLRLRGRVPTFYMKSVLQTLLRDVDRVNQIDNQVNVVSPRGLSSTAPQGQPSF